MWGRKKSKPLLSSFVQASLELGLVHGKWHFCGPVGFLSLCLEREGEPGGLQDWRWGRAWLTSPTMSVLAPRQSSFGLGGPLSSSLWAGSKPAPGGLNLTESSSATQGTPSKLCALSAPGSSLTEPCPQALAVPAGALPQA